jgi:hypothetical protein
VQRVSIEDRPQISTEGDDYTDFRQQRASSAGMYTDAMASTGSHQQPQSKKSSPEAGRLERAGRALRKHAGTSNNLVGGIHSVHMTLEGY